MKLLLLFVTQAQRGAPGYLSRNGEDAAANLAETLARFLGEQLRLDLESGFAARAASLAKDPHWKELGRPGALTEAFTASASLYPDVVLSSGADIGTMKTMEIVSSHFALPVVVHPGLDRDSRSDPPSKHLIAGALLEVLDALRTARTQARVVVVGTSRAALLEWLEGKIPKEQHVESEAAFTQLSGEDELPVVYTAALNGDPRDALAWLFD